MPKKRLAEIIKYIKELRESALRRSHRYVKGSCLHAEAEDNYTSLTHVLTILQEDD